MSTSSHFLNDAGSNPALKSTKMSTEKPKREPDTLELVTDPSSSPVPTSSVLVDLAGMSHVGHVRTNNEDHFLGVRFGRSLETLFTNAEGLQDSSFDETGYGILVADGLGGMAAGEVASRTALLRLVELVVNTPDWIMNLSRDDEVNVVMRRMTRRFRQVDDSLKEQAKMDHSLTGMGTTLTTAVSLGSDALIAHIGDSRAYLYRDNKLQQLTRDHTLAQAMIDAGMGSQDDATTRAMRHVLTAALGSTNDSVNPQVQRLQIQSADQLLLCTDGLTEMVKDEIIASVLRLADNATIACQTLVDLALKAGGRDNVTVALARYRFTT
jgi:protein phosphatase